VFGRGFGVERWMEGSFIRKVEDLELRVFRGGEECLLQGRRSDIGMERHCIRGFYER
jgi:hypothetical protein